MTPILQVLYSRIIGGLWGPSEVREIKLRSDACKASARPAVLALWPPQEMAFLEKENREVFLQVELQSSRRQNEQ